MNFMANESAQKLRGGYYTPVKIATFITRWMKESNAKTFLEPSCGDGAFFAALADAGFDESITVKAFELDPIEAKKAAILAGQKNISARIKNTDFLRVALDELTMNNQEYDAVIGNPPFIRYQYLPSEFQDLAEAIFKQLNCKFTKHTNAWVPFVMAAIAMLKPGGRLGMVIPSEIIHVLHAQSLRTLLGHLCKKIVIIDPEEIWFEGTLQGAVILMAEKKLSESDYGHGLGLVQVRGDQFLTQSPTAIFNSVNAINGRTVEGKWTKAFLSKSSLELLDAAEQFETVHRFKSIAKVDVGIVTGANSFFLVNDETVKAHRLSSWSHPMFGRSEHCPGVIYDDRQHTENRKKGLPSNFLWFPEGSADKYSEVADYLKIGIAQDLHTRYKTRIRKYWYTVPSVSSSQIGMLKRSHDVPRLILNSAEAYTTDTAYRISSKFVDAQDLVTAFLNPLTALSAELEGRTYGGGVLELVPSEIEKLLIPIPTNSNLDIQRLDTLVRTGSMTDVLTSHGLKVLELAGFTKHQGEELFDAWVSLKNRRQRKGSEDH
ncbi:N-6 DNA methylase [Pseudomonas sp. NEEL19]|nr:N-6 DNA methylase [Pseudomonas sp. NEEL19]